ncbi:MAG: TonB-dependent receptor [Pseudomonadota bacterium]
MAKSHIINRNLLLAGVAMVAVVATPSVAKAEESRAAEDNSAVEVPDDDEALTAAQNTPAQADDTSEDQDTIIVTGSKIERSLQDTTASVAVINQETITDANFRDIYDVINQTANVASLFDGAGFSIRGLQNAGVGGEATSDVASIFVDGVFIPSSLLTNGAFSVWDVQSVEIFRGPQSTIQGRNSLAGAVVINTVDPGSDFSGDFQFEAAEFDSYRGSAAVTVPIAPGQVSLRLAGDYLRSDGFQTNTFLNRDDIDESEAITARATLLFTPDFAPRFSARFNYTYTDSEEGENRVVEEIFRQTGDRISNQNLIDRQGAEAHIASANLSYDLTDELTLTSITGYIDSTSFFNFDPDNNNPVTSTLAPGDVGVLQRTNSEDRIFTQELRLTYQGDGISALLGGYFFDNQGSFDSDNTTAVATNFAFPDAGTLAFLLTQQGIPTSPAEAAFIRSTIVNAIPAFPVQLVRQSTTDIRNYAIFGEATFDITDRLSVTLGARYDTEEVRQTAFDATSIPTDLSVGDPLIDQIVNLTIAQFANEFNFVADNTFDAFLPKAGISYDVTDNVTVGFTYQRAYRAGALSFNTFRGSLAPPGSTQDDLEALNIVNDFDPEFTNNYEISFRSEWLNGDVTFNANAYIIDYTDQQIVVQLSNNPLDTITDNVGASRLRGFELETTVRPTDGLRLFFNVGYTDTEFTEGGGTLGNDVTGFDFTYAPEFTVGFGGRYEHESGFYANLISRLTAGNFTSFNDLNAETNEARIAAGLPPFPARQDPSGFNNDAFTVDLNLGWEFDNFSVEVFARNLFDEEFFTFDPFNNPVFPTGAGGQADPTQLPIGFFPNNDTTAIANAPQQFGIRIIGGF